MADEVKNREQVLDALVAQRTSELAEKNHALEHAQNVISSELDLARKLQLSILPSHFPNIAGCDGHARMLPATHMGGDFYDFVELPDGRVGLIVADVSGKGVAAAFFMAVARTSINSLLRSLPDNPGACLSAANSEICAQNPLDLFVTVFLAVFDPKSGELRYSNAGHNPPMVRRSGGTIEMVASDQDLALGVFEPLEYPTRTLKLNSGDQLVMFTDGVTEAFNGNEKMFGESGLKAMLEESPHETAAELAERIFEEVHRFADGHPQSDDITVAVLKVA